MPDHTQPELIGDDQEPQSNEILPIWGWWLLALGLAVVSTVSLWFARFLYDYLGSDPLTTGNWIAPPPPFQSTQDKVWLFAAGAAIGLSVLATGYVIRPGHRRSRNGWRSAAKRKLAHVVRSPSEADADALGSVHSRAWRAAYSGGLMPDETLDQLSAEVRADMWRSRLAQPVADRSARFVVENPDGIVVGFVRVGPEEHNDAATTGELYAINVDPDSWGTGAGRALHAFALDALRDAGFERAVLWVLSENRRARHFYEALGWRTDGVERIGVVHGVEVPEVRYSRNLI